jgi:hypothetical protein
LVKTRGVCAGEILCASAGFYALSEGKSIKKSGGGVFDPAVEPAPEGENIRDCKCCRACAIEEKVYISKL